MLIIEDQKDTLEALSELVKSVDSTVTVFPTMDKESAYNIAMEYTINLFLIDIVLEPQKKGGDVSGVVFAQNIRKIDKYIDTPMIFITSLYDSDNWIYSELYCLQFIEKPFDPERVKKEIGRALRFKTICEDDKTWYYHNEGLMRRLFTKDIIYTTSKNHVLHIVTTKETIKIPNFPCKRFIREIDSDNFIRCFRGTVVNAKHISKVDTINRYIYFSSCNEVLEIGQSYKKAFLRHWKMLQ